MNFNKIIGVRQVLLAVTVASACVLVPIQAAYAQSDTKPVKVRYVLSHRTTLLETLPSYVAEEKGLFTKNGVQVEYIAGSGGGSTVRLLSTGDVEMAKGGLPATILAAKSDPRILLIGGWFHSAGGLVWIAKKSSGIKSVAALDGAKLGYTGAASASQWLMQESIKRAGIKNVTAINLGGVGAMGDNWTAVKGGVLTAGWAMEPFLSDKVLNDGAEVVLNPSHYIKHYYLEGIAVNKRFAEEHPEAVRAVLKTMREAAQYIKEHPDEAAEIGAKYYKTSKQIILAGIKTYVNEDVWNMKVDPEAFTTVMRGMLDTGLLSKEIDIGALLDQRYLAPDLQTSFEGM